tara:strand:+ start:168 stop:362 length:195 start_codon:yes stop_codon:yes gene_type:complete
MSNYDGWTVVLHEMMIHIQKFVDDNPMEYKGKELKAYTTALGMVSVLAKQMIEDIQREKTDVEV